MREKGEILFSTEVMVFKCQNFYKRINAMNKSTRITSDRQIVFDEVMAKMKEVFIGQAQNGMDEHIGNWNGYFEYLSENVVIHDDLNFIDDWSSRECLQSEIQIAIHKDRTSKTAPSSPSTASRAGS